MGHRKKNIWVIRSLVFLCCAWTVLCILRSMKNPYLLKVSSVRDSSTLSGRFSYICIRYLYIYVYVKVYKCIGYLRESRMKWQWMSWGGSGRWERGMRDTRQESKGSKYIVQNMAADGVFHGATLQPDGPATSTHSLPFPLLFRVLTEFASCFSSCRSYHIYIQYMYMYINKRERNWYVLILLASISVGPATHQHEYSLFDDISQGPSTLRLFLIVPLVHPEQYVPLAALVHPLEFYPSHSLDR